MELSHVDDKGKARMVDVGGKPVQRRLARARGSIVLAPATIEKIRDNSLRKGDVLTVAKLAGLQAAKQTSQLIPLCHTLILDQIDLTLTLTEQGVAVESEVRCTGRTGAEMEALTAVSIALLTVYDMCKAVDKQMRLTDVVLMEKIKE